MNPHFRLPSLFLTIASLSVCHPSQAADAAPAAAGRSDVCVIPASDSRFRYEGRFDMSDPARPGVIWEASRISLEFEGPSLKLLFSDIHGECFFNAAVDGVTNIVELSRDHPAGNTTFTNLGPGRHLLKLFKRSEASAGWVRFEGVELAPGANAWTPPAPAYKTKMLFLGDSISAGACDEDGAQDQWVDHRTHNSAKSYTALTAAAFDADFQNISVSGMGVVTGYVPWAAGKIWDRINADPNSPRADLTLWTPRIVLVNLGENDGSYPKSRHESFPTNYTEAYIAFIHNVRAAYPKAEIVLLLGGMWNGANNADLKNAWQAAVAELEKSDRKISHFTFKHWTGQHPRVADHQAMADELIVWLKQQDFMRHPGP
jgi:lysophospholipase L1-like esterase